MTDPRHVAALARAVLAGDYDTCGVLADYLEERGDPRGVLLRRRWKMWRNERERDANATAEKERAFALPWQESLQMLRDAGWQVEGGIAHVKLSGESHKIDAGLRLYVHARFPEAREVPT